MMSRSPSVRAGRHEHAGVHDGNGGRPPLLTRTRLCDAASTCQKNADHLEGKRQGEDDDAELGEAALRTRVVGSRDTSGFHVQNTTPWADAVSDEVAEEKARRERTEQRGKVHQVLGGHRASASGRALWKPVQPVQNESEQRPHESDEAEPEGDHRELRGRAAQRGAGLRTSDVAGRISDRARERLLMRVEVWGVLRHVRSVSLIPHGRANALPEVHSARQSQRAAGGPRP
jgi:hypothetical protein